MVGTQMVAKQELEVKGEFQARHSKGPTLYNPNPETLTDYNQDSGLARRAAFIVGCKAPVQSGYAITFAAKKVEHFISCCPAYIYQTTSKMMRPKK